MPLHSERTHAPPERVRRASANMPARIRSRHSQRLAIAVARSCARGECRERGFAFPRKTLAPPLPRAHGLGDARRDERVQSRAARNFDADLR